MCGVPARQYAAIVAAERDMFDLAPETVLSLIAAAKNYVLTRELERRDRADAKAKEQGT